MFGKNILRKEVNIGITNSFYLLPTIKIDITDNFFEITFYLFKFYIYTAYSIYNYDES